VTVQWWCCYCMQGCPCARPRAWVRPWCTQRGRYLRGGGNIVFILVGPDWQCRVLAMPDGWQCRVLAMPDDGNASACYLVHLPQGVPDPSVQ